MKSLLSFVILAFTSSLYAAPVQLGSIICNFDRPRNQVLEAKIFRDGKRNPYANVEIVKYSDDSRNAIRTVLSKYVLSYVQPKGMSLFWTYENTKDQVRLNAFGDDMGGVSSWEVKGKKTDVTCMVDIEVEE